MTETRKRPVWMEWIIREGTDGIEEEPNRDNRGPVIDKLIKLSHCGHPGDPYCAIGVNAALEANGIPGTRSAAARSFEWDAEKFTKLHGPALGAITVFWRGSRKSGLGHVGVYDGETENHIYVWGFNQHDDCNVSPFPKDGQSFGLSGFYWPRPIVLPVIQKIALNGKGEPINIKVV
jgi:hypothetical protein